MTEPSKPDSDREPAPLLPGERSRVPAGVRWLIVCAIVWAIASAHGNHHAATRARTGLWVAVGAAALAGAGVAWLNFLVDVGTRL